MGLKMKSIKHIQALFIGVAVMALFSSCDDSKNRTQIKLSYQERRAVDTLYKERVIELGTVMDSICDANFDNMVQTSIDSILTERRAEEERLRKKIPIQR